LFFSSRMRMGYTVMRSVPFLYRGAVCVFRRRVRVEVLDALSIGVSIFRGDFDTAESVMFLLELGELLEEWTHKKSVDDLARSMALNVDRVWLVRESGDTLVPVEEISAGDRIRIGAGSMVPVDGTVTEGEAMVNQASLTGEPLPVPRRAGATVYAGTVVEEGSLVLEASGVPGESRYDRIVAMIEDSQKLSSDTENRAARLADRLVPYSLAGTALTYLLTRNITRAVSLLMVDFSCALKLTMPLSFLSAMGEAGRRHITVKGGKFLEAAACADTIVFDKTGTLTRACPTVAAVIPFGGWSERDALRLAACLEEHFPHSIANAVTNRAKELGLKHDEMHTEAVYVVAHGIASSVGGQRTVIGSHHFVFEDEHCQIPKGDQARFDSLPPEHSHLYLAVGGELAAVICVADPLRPEAKAALACLRELGVSRMVMMTGDSERTAAAAAKEAGVDAFYAEVLPEDKAAFVQAERDAGATVLMIGDGINDTPALSAANVGIAISDGAVIAREVADITIAADSLWELALLRKLSMALMERVQRNYRFIMGFNGTLLALGALGVLNPASSALLHNLSTLLAGLHSMTPLLRER
ncbi:MAG: heavy metal translocating P-type ATPase, partial [Oscillibacter sp.]|nr:heavy metal translocating P-type ATPase [Oscillibacter sp.]